VSSTTSRTPSTRGVSPWRARFKGQPIAICLELQKGTLVYALRKYDCLVGFPVNPLTLAGRHHTPSPSQPHLSFQTVMQFSPTKLRALVETVEKPKIPKI
jgi:hypothetical protein